ncbi:MAG: class I tRNA ligase family protein [Nitrospiraceae bacterium]
MLEHCPPPRPGRVEQLLTERGLLEKIRTPQDGAGQCYRCKTVVEPLLSDQWFVKIKPLAEPAVQVVEDGRVRIIPETWKNNYLGWMRDIKDWCVSRQNLVGSAVRLGIVKLATAPHSTGASDGHRSFPPMRRRSWRRRHREPVQTVTAAGSSKTRMCSIPGSHRPCGRSRPSDGRNRQRN